MFRRQWLSIHTYVKFVGKASHIFEKITLEFMILGHMSNTTPVN